MRSRLLMTLNLQADLRHRNVVLRAAHAAAALVGHGEHPSFDDQVVAACGEAFNNIVLHGYRESPGQVEIQIEVAEDSMTIRMLDHGKSYEPDTHPDPDLESLPESGMGIFIMKSFMDRVTYRPGDPNLLEMTKRITPRTSPEPTFTDEVHPDR